MPELGCLGSPLIGPPNPLKSRKRVAWEEADGTTSRGSGPCGRRALARVGVVAAATA
jgi:hypothetical protein